MMGRPTMSERARTLPGDRLVRDAVCQVMHAVTITAASESVWPWLVQMGAGRAGWYSYDWIDNDGRPSAVTIVAALQHIAVGDIMPSLPGAADSFLVSAVQPFRDLTLAVRSADGTALVSWEFFLEPMPINRTRLMVRGRVSVLWPHNDARNAHSSSRPIEQLYRLLGRIPRPLMTLVARFGHGLMQVHQLNGIKRRAEHLYGSRQKTQ